LKGKKKGWITERGHETKYKEVYKIAGGKMKLKIPDRNPGRRRKKSKKSSSTKKKGHHQTTMKKASKSSWNAPELKNRNPKKKGSFSRGGEQSAHR